jgi:hypothetical protein
MDLENKIKELEKVAVPPFPNAITLYTWKTNLARAVVVAAGNPDYAKVTNWINKIWSSDTMEALDDPGEDVFVMLDFKLAEGMEHMLHKGGEKSKRVMKEVHLKMEEASRKGSILKGRQIAWMIAESFKTHDRSELLFSFDHLSNLSVHDLYLTQAS